ITVRTIVKEGERREACGLLAEAAGLPKLRIKDAMQKGAVWRVRRGHAQRLRRAKAVLQPGEELALYYDDDLLGRDPPAAECRHDLGRYSVWFKPVGLMTQGTRYGDHCSLLRQAEIFLRPERLAFMVHRLDREASGLVIIAHDRDAAGALSRLFAERRIIKCYRAELLGRVGPQGSSGRIDMPLDGRTAVTDYRVVSYDPTAGTSVVDIEMSTGRKHQIRQHFAMTGFPVMGDPSYGKNNKNTEGLKLAAWGLEFTCPFTGRSMVFRLERMP
ncbi:MAG: RluA family pseudouridine synthase, partial [Hyphomicrobiales bacterium]